MIPDLCGWAYEWAASWFPPLSLLWGEPRAEEETKSPVSSVADDESTPSPATTEALARAREALQHIDRARVEAMAPSRADARFRSSPPTPILGAGAGIQRLAGRLDEIDVDGLGAEEREALMGAASGLIVRLRESML